MHQNSSNFTDVLIILLHVADFILIELGCRIFRVECSPLAVYSQLAVSSLVVVSSLFGLTVGFVGDDVVLLRFGIHLR